MGGCRSKLANGVGRASIYVFWQIVVTPLHPGAFLQTEEEAWGYAYDSIWSLVVQFPGVIVAVAGSLNREP